MTDSTGSAARTDAETVETDVAIVGGGLAGLTTAVGLMQDGLDVVLVERDRRLGGRAQSWTDETTGDPVHIGPHIFLSKYPNMLALLDLLGTRDDIVWQDDHFITVVEGQKEVVMKQHPLPPPFHFLPSMLADDRLPMHHRITNVPVALYAMQMCEDDVMRLDGINAYAFLRRMGVSKALIDQFWAFTCRAIMNVPIELCSAGALMRFFKRFIGHQSFSFGFPDGGLGDLFAPQSRDYIEERGGTVMLETEVDRFALDGERVAGLELSDGRRIEAEHTVAAVPPTALRQLIPRSWVGKWDVFGDLGHFEPSSYYSPYIWFDRKLTDRMMWARGHSQEDLNCDFYDLSNILSGWEGRNSYITSNIIYADRVEGMSDQAIIEGTVDEISDYLPEASMEHVEHAVVNRIPMAIHCPYPGTERRRPPTRAPVDGLLFAGDWVQTHLPASMESAVMAGWRAAEIALEDRGESADLVVEHPDVEGLHGLIDRGARWLPHRQIDGLLDRVRRGIDALTGRDTAEV